VGLTARSSPWICYLFDRAVAVFGLSVETDLENERQKKDGNPKRRLEQLLRPTGGKPGEPKKMTVEQLIFIAGPNASVKDVP